MGTMSGFAAVDFGVAREVLQRGIAVLFLLGFLTTLTQFRPLTGERGLLPAPDFLPAPPDPRCSVWSGTPTTVS